MPEPKFSSSGPPPSKRETAKARGPVDPEDAPERVASTEPDDDLSDYVVPPDPEPEEIESVDAVPVDAEPETSQEPTSEADESVVMQAPTTAETELVSKLRDELARAELRLANREADVGSWAVAAAPTKPKKGEKVLIHIRQDGFTANGRVWYQGQELEFTVGEQNWNDTLDREGNSWLLMTEADQLRRYGQVMFGFGPWPGATYENTRAAEAERSRGRAAPTITRLTSTQQVRT